MAKSRSRSSVTLASKGGFAAAPEMKRVISLGGGTWAYLCNPQDGKTGHYKVEDEAFIQNMVGFGEEWYDRLDRTLDALAQDNEAWASVHERFTRAVNAKASEDVDE